MKGGGRELSSRVRVRQGAPKDPTARDTAHWDRRMRQVRKRKSISMNLVEQRGEHAHHIRTCHRTTLHPHVSARVSPPPRPCQIHQLS